MFAVTQWSFSLFVNAVKHKLMGRMSPVPNWPSGWLYPSFFFYSSLVFSVVYISRNFYPNNGNFYLSLWIELVASSIHIHPVLMWGCMRCWCSPSVPSRRDFNPTVDPQEICSLMEAIKSEIWNERCSAALGVRPSLTFDIVSYLNRSRVVSSLTWSRTLLATGKSNSNCS